jgi:cysteine desulfuration protein SufE
VFTEDECEKSCKIESRELLLIIPVTKPEIFMPQDQDPRASNLPSDPFESCLEKQKQIKALFLRCSSEEEKYQKIIELGRQQPRLPGSDKIPENLVKGCQSNMYLTSNLSDGRVFYAAESDALISAGLAVVLIKVYSGETPETILKCPPDYLEELGISANLTPSRANGLYSIHLRMKQDALKIYMRQHS